MPSRRAHERSGFLLTVILGLLVFTVVVAFHEMGHFFMARLCGVGVERFSIGFGPVIFSRQRGETQYAISAFPLGGYVKMRGDDPRKRERLIPGDFFAAAWWRRVLIAVGGPFANFVFAILLSITLAWVGFNLPDAPNIIGAVPVGSSADSLGFRSGDVVVQAGGEPVDQRHDLVQALLEAPQGTLVPVVVARNGGRATLSVPQASVERLFQTLDFPLPPTIGSVINASPAYQAGLEEGDQITMINGHPIAQWSDLTELIHGSPGVPIQLKVTRAENAFELEVTPMSQERDGKKIGLIGISPDARQSYRVRYSGWTGISRGVVSTVDMVKLYYSFFWGLVSDFAGSISQVSGPVAIIQATGDAAQRGMDQLLSLAVMLNVALMVFNLLPIPILDGGMVMLSVLEGARKRPLADRGLTVYQGIGLSIIGALLIFVLINDPLRILKRQQAVERVTTSPSASP